MSDKQQTAVEWFFMTMNIRGLLPNQEIVECYMEAKQIEKEQIVFAWDISRRDIDWQANGEQYYNEIYNTIK